MRGKLIVTTLLLMAVGCSSDKLTLPDHKDTIDENTARIQLLEANDKLQDLRLNNLESRVSSLETRMTDAEDSIDSNEEKISKLCEAVAGLDEELSSLRSDLRDSVRELRRADRQTRRLLRKKVAKLRYKLLKEIRARKLADAELQEDLDSLERFARKAIARQAAYNRFLTRSLLAANNRITLLENRVQRYLRQIKRRLNSIEGDIDSINSSITRLTRLVRSVSSRVSDLEENMISVYYPCGEEDELVLFETPEGLVGYVQEMGSETVRFHDTVKIPGFTVGGYHIYIKDSHRYHSHTRSAYIRKKTVPTRTYTVSDTATFPVIIDAYLGLIDEEDVSCEGEDR